MPIVDPYGLLPTNTFFLTAIIWFVDVDMSLSDKPTSQLAVLSHVKLLCSSGETAEYTDGLKLYSQVNDLALNSFIFLV